MNIEPLQLGLTALTFIGVIISLLTPIYRRGKYDKDIENQIKTVETKITTTTTGFERSVAEINEKIDDFKTELGNGGFGLKKEIKTMQTNCAAEMNRVVATMEGHINLSSHPGVEGKLADLQARVKNLEEER